MAVKYQNAVDAFYDTPIYPAVVRWEIDQLRRYVDPAEFAQSGYDPRWLLGEYARLKKQFLYSCNIWWEDNEEGKLLRCDISLGEGDNRVTQEFEHLVPCEASDCADASSVKRIPIP